MKQNRDLFEIADAGLDSGLHWPQVRAWLEANPEHLQGDRSLLEGLSLRPTGKNVVEFGAVALSRLQDAVEKESGARKAVEAVARANFAAQAQTHVAALDLLEARNHSDLARRLDAMAQARFGLACATILLEKPGAVPFGWRPLDEGDVDGLVGEDGLSWLGPACAADALFGAQADRVRSVALVRMTLWSPRRPALVAFGSDEPEGFSRDMGCELIAFLTRVVEKTAERWPVLSPTDA